MLLEELVKGKVLSTKDGNFLLVERTLAEADAGDLGAYVESRREGLSLANIRDKFPSLSKIQKKGILFFDTENCGLSYKDPVFIIGALQILDGIDIKCLIARDYSEERPMIRYFLEQLHNYNALLTYNGSSFDLPRLSERAKQNGIDFGGAEYKTLEELSWINHIDLYPRLRQRLTKEGKQLPDYRLKTVEKILFNVVRKGDIAGRAVPEAYHTFVSGVTKGGERADESKAVTKMARVVHHNILDTISLAVVFSYLCAE